MRKSITTKAGAIGTAFVLAGGLAVIASGTTGAYFSDTKTGEITGTTGSIQISTIGSTGTGANDLNFSFAGLMPGEAKTATVNYKNTGTNTQDIYLTFPNVPALHALNNLGSYGEVHVVNGNGEKLFDSVNLSDGRKFADGSGTCGTLAPTGCWPLPTTLKVASNVAASTGGSVSFSFNYASKLKGTGGGVFNSYPLTNGEGSTADLTGTPGNGLPVNVVAVQVGQQP